MELKAAALSFAHLLGLPRAETEDKDKNPVDEKPTPKGADESDEDYEKRKKAQDDEKKKDAKKAESENETDEEKKKREEKEKEENESEGKKASGRERARCAQIFNSDAAGVRPDMAAHLAFETDMPAAAAIKLLEAAAVGMPKSVRLRDRMAAETIPVIPVGGDPNKPAAGTADALAVRMAIAYQKATGRSA
jgi:outer membrane biosynthesis protein TonB